MNGLSPDIKWDEASIYVLQEIHRLSISTEKAQRDMERLNHELGNLNIAIAKLSAQTKVATIVMGGLGGGIVTVLAGLLVRHFFA